MRSLGSAGLYSASPAQLQQEPPRLQQCVCVGHMRTVTGTEERVRRCDQCSFYPKAVGASRPSPSKSCLSWRVALASLFPPLPMTPSNCHCCIMTYRAFCTAPLAFNPHTGSAPSILAVPSPNSLPQAASASAGDTCVPFSRALGKQPTFYVTGVKDFSLS